MQGAIITLTVALYAKHIVMCFANIAPTTIPSWRVQLFQCQSSMQTVQSSYVVLIIYHPMIFFLQLSANHCCTTAYESVSSCNIPRVVVYNPLNSNWAAASHQTLKSYCVSLLRVGA